MTPRMLRLTGALLIFALTACGSGSDAEAPIESSAPTTRAPASTPFDPNPAEVTVTASTTHDEGATLTWDGQEQEIENNNKFEMTFETPPAEGTTFALQTAGVPQSSAVICTIVVDGETVVYEHDPGTLPATFCVMPALD